MLRRLDGRYRFEAEATPPRCTTTSSVDVVDPVPGLIKRRAAGLIMGTALKELKKAVEKK